MAANLFSDDQVNLEVLRQRAIGMRWASVPQDTIPLTAADPDFPPAREITDAMIEFLQGRYIPYGGIPGVREAMSRFLLERKNERIDPDFIIPVDSAAAGLQAIACALLEPGDEAIVFDPVDLLFGVSVRYVGATEVFYPSVWQDGRWKLDDLESYITPKTKMICLCNPHNPMGYLYTREDVEHIARLAQKYNLWIMNDEIWSDIVYSEHTYFSINSLGPELNRRTISCYGLSKGFALAGLRAGCVYAQSQEALDAVSKIANGHVHGMDSVAQTGMKAALEKAGYWQDAFVAHLQGNRDMVYERFSRMPLIKATLQQCTFVTFPDISATGLSSQEFVDFMQKEQKVVLVPGTKFWFGPRAEGHVRLCYATSRAILKEGLDRIEEGLHKLEKRGRV